ncbi:MAG: ABC transporter ATP-binding protein [Candidatus Neomarinimicrobiota bacterium]|nr:ABC transporter ATP-binding protein [Candidatus Neomarinimicrobiota bacterium]
MNKSAVKISKLKKNYGDTYALNGLDMSIPKGSFFGLLGPNGAGKTTTINILTGLVKKNSGETLIFGHDTITEYRKARKLIGLAPQELSFDFFFNIRDMLALQGGYYGMSFKEGRKRADELIEQFGLTDKANSNARQLSGGMKRRLQIAKALMHDPPLIILDEPTAGVDIELRHMLWDFLKVQNHQKGKTILLTTHYIEEAENLCDTVAIIDNGKIIKEGSPKSLIQSMGDSKLEIKVKNLDKDLKIDKEHIISDNLLQIPSKNPEKEMIWWIEELKDNNIRIEDVRISKSNLEDVFLKLTGRSLND